MKKILWYAAMAAVGLIATGCAGWHQSVTAFNSAAAVSVRDAQDTHVEVLKFDLCATPFSTILRHPELAAAIEAVCIPGGEKSTPVTLLNDIAGK